MSFTGNFPDSGRLWRHEDIAGGQVCFNKTGIIVTFVAERFAAGDSVAELAKDYPALKAEDIEAGLRLVIAAAGGQRGIRRAVERRMEERIPLTLSATQAVAQDGSGTMRGDDPHVPAAETES